MSPVKINFIQLKEYINGAQATEFWGMEVIFTYA